MRGRNARQDFRFQAARFGSEDQDIVRSVAHAIEAHTPVCGEGKQACRSDVAQEGGQGFVLVDAGELGVIETGAPELSMIEREAQRVNEMQLCARVRAQANNVAGVRRDLRLKQGHGRWRVPGRRVFSLLHD